MKLVLIDSFYINPDAIAYVSTKATGPMASGGAKQNAVLHFIGGGELPLSITAGALAQQLEKIPVK